MAYIQYKVKKFLLQYIIIENFFTIEKKLNKSDFRNFNNEN